MATSQRSPKRPAARKTAAPRRPPAIPDVDPDDGVDEEVDEMTGAAAAQDETEPRDIAGPVKTTKRMTSEERRTAELEAALRIQRSGEAVFKYPVDLPEEHKPYWAELVNSRPHDYFNISDLSLLRMYCRVAWDIDRLTKEIIVEGEVILNMRGNPVVNPKVLVRSIAETRFFALATKLRAQPASRYDSGNDRKQSEKKRKATAAARSIDESHDDYDGDSDEGLLAGSGPSMVQ